MKYIKIFLILSFIFLLSCSNNPYPSEDDHENIYYSYFPSPPQTLDPAQAYNVNEDLFIAQIYEPPLQYHYLKRPYELIPLTALSMPRVEYFSRTMKKLSLNAKDSEVAFSVYTIPIKKNILFEPHPAFAKNKNDKRIYANFSNQSFHHISDFKYWGTRELQADDYIYQIKRLASPKTASPISGLMKNHIQGWTDFQKKIMEAQKNNTDSYLDLRKFSLEGVKKINAYTYSITILGKYPQFLYWLAVPFFSPVPWEADHFYSRPGMADKNLTLDTYPVGTGAYRLMENNPNQKIILAKNPLFHGEYFPKEGEPSDEQKGLLKYAGRPLPFIEKAIFFLEKESIPQWNKFLQGYYDESTIDPNSFDQIVTFNSEGDLNLTKNMKAKNIHLTTSVAPSIYYFGFNMLDPIVGGNSDHAKKLRQAISIAIDIEEYIQIFLNGRAIPAQGPLPPGIFGYDGSEKDFNPIVYQENKIRRSLQTAKKLLADAGYPNGIDPKTRQALVLNYDTAITGLSDESRLNWLRKQFSKIGISLNIRATQDNRYEEKLRTGNVQIFLLGWLADYPDPENFLFLFYGKNSKVRTQGENVSNYMNPQFDKFFDQMKNLPNSLERKSIIQKMVHILQEDSPIVFGFHVKNYILSQGWVMPYKAHGVAYNVLKYKMLDPDLRVQKRKEWNHPDAWPVAWIFLIVFLFLIPAFIQYWKKEYHRKDFPEYFSKKNKKEK